MKGACLGEGEWGSQGLRPPPHLLPAAADPGMTEGHRSGRYCVGGGGVGVGEGSHQGG